MYEQSQIHNNGLSQCWLLGVPLIIAEDDRYEGRHINHSTKEGSESAGQRSAEVLSR